METRIFCEYTQTKQKFKSYYVVWKPMAIGIIRPALRSLNRTMQYGNGYIAARKAAAQKGLNRTMQYGNSLQVWAICRKK